MTTASTFTDRTLPRVLFVGREASSPQIAASLLRQATRGSVKVQTATTRPADSGGRSDEMLVAMGLDPAEQQRLGTNVLYTADRVVVLDADLDVARLPGPRYEEWDLEQDDLIVRVQALSDELTRVPAADPHPPVLDRLRSLFAAIRRG